MCMKLGMHLCFPIARELARSRGQLSNISALLAHGQPSESLVLLTIG